MINLKQIIRELKTLQIGKDPYYTPEHGWRYRLEDVIEKLEAWQKELKELKNRYNNRGWNDENDYYDAGATRILDLIIGEGVD